jgi:hypothetical protein
MNSRDITREQATTMLETVEPMLTFTNRLLARLKERGFSHTDPLHVAAERAHDGIHHLWVLLHYASCGVAGQCASMPPRPPEPPNSGEKPQ